MLVQFKECALIILFQFEILIPQFFFDLFIFQFNGRGFENFHDNGFWFFLQKDVVQTEQAC